MSHAAISIVGNIGKEPEIKQTSTGGWMARFSVAVSSQVKNKSGYDDVTTWYRVTYFARSDKWMAQFVRGAKVFATGSLIQHSYRDRDGNQASSLEVEATHAESLSPRQDRTEPVQRSAQPQPQQSLHAQEPDINDDIPF